MVHKDSMVFTCDYCGERGQGRLEGRTQRGAFKYDCLMVLPEGWKARDSKDFCSEICHARFESRWHKERVKILEAEEGE